MSQNLHSVADLQNQRLYLLNELNLENVKATSLLHRIPFLEESALNYSATNAQKRKAKKHLGWLKHRFAETNKQEQALLQRIGQLNQEIQRREEEYNLGDMQVVFNRGISGPGVWRDGYYGMWKYMKNDEAWNSDAPDFKSHHMHFESQDEPWDWEQSGIEFSPIPWCKVQEQPSPLDYFGYEFKPRPDVNNPETLSNQTTCRYNRGETRSISPTCAVVEERDKRKILLRPVRPVLPYRSSSFSVVSLDTMATSTTGTTDSCDTQLRENRKSMPALSTLHGVAKDWGPTTKDMSPKERRMTEAEATGEYLEFFARKQGSS